VSRPVTETAVLLGRRLAGIRERRGWKQTDLAEKAGLSVAFISEIENGKRNVSSEKLLQLANALGASIDYLLRGEDAVQHISTPVTVPPELSQAAEQEGWGYGQTIALLQMHDLVRAKRSPGGQVQKASSELRKEDWIKLFKKIFLEE
jgi:transcriptional regulator with XRE-family HTH domain